MTDNFAALTLRLSPEFFPDGDDGSRVAGMHLAQELGKHLEMNGHAIPSWVKGGCEEDAWVYLESERSNVRYQYIISYFPRRDEDYWMSIHYDLNVGWLRRLFGASSDIPIGDPIHNVLRDFGAKYKDSNLLTRSEVDAEL